MTYQPTADTAIHALDETQLLAAHKGYAWHDGLSVSLSSATTIIETICQPGEVVFNGETISIGNVTVEHPDGDTTHPRWDAVCVTDRTGTVEAISGLPAEPVTLGDGTTIRGERAWKPAPPDAVTDEMVCLALVWIPSGATTNSDLTDTSNGGVPEPIRDRRIEHEASVSHTTRRTVITSSGWKRIAGLGALSPGGGGAGEAAATFSIRDTQTGLNSTTTVDASVIYSDPALTLRNSTAFVQPHGAIHGVRLVTGGTNDGAALDINVQLGGQTQVDYVEYSMQNNYFFPGWTPVEFETANVPSGYSTSVIDFTARPHMMAAVGQAGENAQFSVDINGETTIDKLNRENVGTRIALTTDEPVADQTMTQIPFDTVIFDDLSLADGFGGVTVDRDGTYLISGAARMVDIPDGTDGVLRVKIDGSNSSSEYKKDVRPAETMTISGGSKVTAGQTVTLAVRMNTPGGASTTIAGARTYTYLSVMRVG